MLFAPFALRSLKTLRALNLGNNITCGILRQPRQLWTTFFFRAMRGALLFIVVVVFFFPSLARTPRGVCVWRSRIAVSATLHVPYRVLRLASAMTAGVDCRCFVVHCCYSCRFISFTNYFYAIFSIAFVSSYFFISSSRFSRQTNEPPFFMRLTICCSFSLSCDLPFSALRSIGLDTILNINL